MENWYLACHKPGKHNAFKAQMFLSRLNAVVFIPQICSYRPRSDRPGQYKRVMESLFPGYMFICFDPEITHTSIIANCPGMGHLVRFSGTIFPVNDAVVEEIMQLPVCVHTTLLTKRKKEKNLSTVTASPVLTEAQRAFIRNMAAEEDGDIRSALFYSFTESAFGHALNRHSG